MIACKGLKRYFNKIISGIIPTIEHKYFCQNAQTLAAMQEVDEMIKTGNGKKYTSVDELFEELNS